MIRTNATPTVAALAAALILTTGCTPSIETFAVTAGEPGEQSPAALTLTTNQSTIQGVDLEVRPVGGDFAAAGALNGSSGSYEGQTPRLGAGDYEARATVRYLRLMLPGEQTSSVTQPFSLGWPAGTFDFDAGGLNGWTYQGVFRVSDGFESCDAGTLTSFPLYSVTTAGWPVGINDTNPGFPSGALRVLVDPSCYPDQPEEVDGAFWQFNLASPDLEGVPEWQGIDGVSFRMISNIPLQVMATVVYADELGEDANASPTASGGLDFAEVGNSWSIIERTGYVPDRPVRRVLIRAFGEPAAVASIGEAATVLLDVVSPIP